MGLEGQTAKHVKQVLLGNTKCCGKCFDLALLLSISSIELKLSISE